MTLFLLALLTAPIATGVGVWFRKRGWPLRWAAWGLVVVAVAYALAIGGLRDPEVTDVAFAPGIGLGTVSLGLLPATFYFVLGRWVTGPWLALALVLTTPALVVFGFYAYVFTLDFVFCPVDAYECPV